MDEAGGPGGRPVIVAGIGSRKGVSSTEVAAALDAALARAGLTRADIGALATPAVKGGEPGITAAATALGLPLVLVPQKTLEAAADRTLTRSDRVVALMGVPSASETAALAACGPSGKLIAPRTAVGPVTCALARREPQP
jgi:cobalt-precorrin 5A hydrolase